MGMSAANKKSAPSINVTPLIDVLLVLLIIFMVITPMKPHRFETKTPEKPPVEQSELPAVSSLLVLTIDKDHQLALNSESLDAGQLATRLQTEMERRPLDRRTLFIKAPRELSYGFVVNIIDIVKGAGAQPIGLQVDFLDAA
jgi:biopolymer transport protein ExbD